MVDFYLHKYNGFESITKALVAPHKYRHPVIINMGQQKDCLKAWNNDKKTIIRNYISKLKEIYKTDDCFLLFSPATQTRIFIDDLIEGITDEFPHVINLSTVFIKKESISFGDEKFKNYTNAQLAEYINVDEETLKSINRSIKKIFIVDDVYATGKSLKLTNYLIKKYIGENFEIKSGVVLKT